MLDILYEDKDIIVVWKPVGVESQESRGFDVDMVSEIRKHIHKKGQKPPGRPAKVPARPVETYVGVIHRLDKPVSGILVYAKTRAAAAVLSRQVTDGRMEKRYLAVICGKVDKNVDNLVDELLKDEKCNLSRIVEKGTKGAKRAELGYRVLEQMEAEPYGALTLVEITLKTGRHHQIRVQMSGHGMPLWGDHKYNPQFSAAMLRISGGGAAQAFVGDVALAAYHLSLDHPVSGRRLVFERMPENPIFRKFDFCAGICTCEHKYLPE